ncbi:MAG: apolipoprotein N-acyltransferase [Desulfuromonas sp.]|nr:MAG: apolipoprotein N-acyltransferase [Desulfuromonas sp.]
MSRIRSLSEFVIALISGLLLACSFPLPGLSLLAWVALVPMILIMARRPFVTGFVAGVGFFAFSLYWLNIVMVTYGRLHPLLSLVAYLLLVLYLALYFGLASWLSCRLSSRLGYPYAMTLPLIWVALEYLRGIVLTGFPWNLLGYSQVENLAMIQSADLVGVYGVSGLIVLSNAVIAAILNWFGHRERRFGQVRYVLLLLILVVANLVYGTWRLGGQSDAGKPIKLAVAQGNIDQTAKWDIANQVHTVETYLRLSKRAAAEGADLAIWPESATPFYLQDISPPQTAVVKFVQNAGISLLTGSPAYEQHGADFRYFNSAYMISPRGRLADRSDKVHLVPFGEYVPFSRFFPFIDKLVYGIGDFSAGEIAPLDYDGKKVGVLVCYEAIFPELARAYSKAGSQLLVNITNDAWFGRSSAPYQHLVMAQVRAVENRRWLARAANTGVSALIAPDGRVVEQSKLFEEAVMTGPVFMRDQLTLYARFGDIFPLFFLVVSLVWIWQSRLRK